MHTPEDAHEEVLPFNPDFMGTYDAITQEIAKNPDVQDREHIGYWRRAGENSVRNFNVSGKGYSELGERVSCTLTKRDEGLDITMRPPNIFDNRCQLFFVRFSDKERTQPFVFRTPVMPSHPTESTDIPELETLDEWQMQALYAAIATASVER